MNVTRLLRNEAALTVCSLGQVLSHGSEDWPKSPPSSTSPIPGALLRDSLQAFFQAAVFALPSEYLHQELFMSL